MCSRGCLKMYWAKQLLSQPGFIDLKVVEEPSTVNVQPMNKEVTLWSSSTPLFFSFSLPKIQSGWVLPESRMHRSRWGALRKIWDLSWIWSIWCSKLPHQVVYLCLCRAAGSILSKIDQSVDPCDDFYSYSCGRWIKENPIPEDSSSYGIYPWLRQEVDIRLKGVFAYSFTRSSSAWVLFTCVSYMLRCIFTEFKMIPTIFRHLTSPFIYRHCAITAM